MFTFCLCLEIDDCTATGMTGCCDDCHAMSIFLASVVTVNNFKANTVRDGICNANTGVKATGLEVYGSFININNCTVTDIQATVPQDLQSSGFAAWGMFITFNGCTASNVQVLDASGKPDTTYGNGVGYGWAPDPRPQFSDTPASIVTYNNCTATNCQVGFDTWSHQWSIWNGNTTNNCGEDMLIQPQNSTRTYSYNHCSEYTGPGNSATATVYNLACDNTYLNAKTPQPA